MNEEIIGLLNEDIEGEHAVIIQYLSHAYSMGEGEMACETEAIARKIREWDLKELLLRIRDHEMYHDDVFGDLLKKEEEQKGPAWRRQQQRQTATVRNRNRPHREPDGPDKAERLVKD